MSGKKREFWFAEDVTSSTHLKIHAYILVGQLNNESRLK